MTTKKKLLITFDYELFLGNRSGYAEDCMLAPTRAIIELLERFGMRAIFFVDTTYLLRLKQQSETTPKCAEDFNKISLQLCTLVEKGHYVFPHLHPHWLDAEYLKDSNQWRLNSTKKYIFRNISTNERNFVFDGSVNLLKEILHHRFPDYKINAFRAGGWSIQPFTDFIPYFEKHGFRYEFSVLGGFYQFTDAQYFDFSLAPEKPVYSFKNDICLEDTSGPYVQFNISSIAISSFTSFLNKVWLKLHMKITNDHTFHKGEGQPSRIMNDIKPASARGKNIAEPGNERVAIELLTLVKLNAYNKFIEENNYMHFISHPKMITAHNMSVFNKFLEKASKNYTIESDFHKMLPQ